MRICEAWARTRDTDMTRHGCGGTANPKKIRTKGHDDINIMYLCM